MGILDTLFGKNMESSSTSVEYPHQETTPIWGGLEAGKYGNIAGLHFDQYIDDLERNVSATKIPESKQEQFYADPNLIEGITLGESERAKAENFYSNGGKNTPEDFVEIARKIPTVRERLEDGASLDNLLDDPELSDCARIYFKEVTEVEDYGDYLAFGPENRHRVLAARMAGVDMPVKITGRVEDRPAMDLPKVTYGPGLEDYQTRYPSSDQTYSDLLSQRDDAKLAADSKMSEIRDYVFENNMDRAATERDPHYQEMISEYKDLDAQYQQARSDVNKFEGENPDVVERAKSEQEEAKENTEEVKSQGQDVDQEEASEPYRAKRYEDRQEPTEEASPEETQMVDPEESADQSQNQEQNESLDSSPTQDAETEQTQNQEQDQVPEQNVEQDPWGDLEKEESKEDQERGQVRNQNEEQDPWGDLGKEEPKEDQGQGQVQNQEQNQNQAAEPTQNQDTEPEQTQNQDQDQDAWAGLRDKEPEKSQDQSQEQSQDNAPSQSMDNEPEILM